MSGARDPAVSDFAGFDARPGAIWWVCWLILSDPTYSQLLIVSALDWYGAREKASVHFQMSPSEIMAVRAELLSAGG